MKAFRDGLSIKFPSDEYQIKFIQEHWDVCERESCGVEKERVEYYLRLLRQKLMTLSSNGQEEFTLRNIFRNFDTNQNGTLNL